MTIFSNQDFVKSMMKDLNKILQLLKKNFPGVKVIGGMELIYAARVSTWKKRTWRRITAPAAIERLATSEPVAKVVSVTLKAGLRGTTIRTAQEPVQNKGDAVPSFSTSSSNSGSIPTSSNSTSNTSSNTAAGVTQPRGGRQPCSGRQR
jgi:hypothetical protein